MAWQLRSFVLFRLIGRVARWGGFFDFRATLGTENVRGSHAWSDSQEGRHQNPEKPLR